MWSPTHVQVTVQKAKGVLTKGKNGTNDAFVTIGLGKEKYQTSVKEKVPQDVEWHEECELPIPQQGNTAEIVLTLLHRNFIGVDEFLGVVNIPLADFDVYERPRNRVYNLKSKPGKEKNKLRGELEVKVAFIVKAGSLTDLSKKEKHKSSLGQLSHMAQSVGGSLLSIGSLEKRKGLKKLAKSIGHKVTRSHKKRGKEESVEGEISPYRRSAQVVGDADPGVISEGESEDDFTFDDLSHKSSGSSLNTNQAAATPVIGSLENLAGGEFLRRSVGNPSTPPMKSPRIPQDKAVDEWEQKLYGKQGKESYVANMETLKRRSWENPKIMLSSQPEEEELEQERITAPHQPDAAPRKLVEDNPKYVVEPHQEEKEKEKEFSKLARKFKNFRKDKEIKLAEIPLVEERIIISGENEGVPIARSNSNLSQEIIQKFDGKTREDVIEILCTLQVTLDQQNKKLKDLEDYLDNLLLRVMETTPRILQNPYVTSKLQAKKQFKKQVGRLQLSSVITS